MSSMILSTEKCACSNFLKILLTETIIRPSDNIMPGKKYEENRDIYSQMKYTCAYY